MITIGRAEGDFIVKSGLAQMTKRGLIMDVVTADQARIAQEAGVSVHSFIHLFIYSFVHLFFYSFTHLFINSFVH